MIRSIVSPLKYNKRLIFGKNRYLAANLIAIKPLSSDNKKNQTKIEPKSTFKSEQVVKFLGGAVKGTIDIIANPRKTWNSIKEIAHHYWVGSKLLWSEIKIARQIISRVVQGHSMTRRERIQLIRTTTDIFRLVPFAIFVIVPFMELLLPFALKLFPNMLPSTFQDSLKKEESMKKELQMRLAIAKFMQETLQEIAEKKSKVIDSSRGKELVDFVEKIRLGETIPNETVIKMASLFKDELTLANISRPQLVSMCRYMGLQPYGADVFLRFQLRTKFRAIREDDRRILWEGIDSLNTLELREACRERGMPSIGITQFRLKQQLKEWLDLSIQKHIPISLLIMSRSFMVSSTFDNPEQILKSSMSSLDSDIINEVVISVASKGEESSLDIQRRKLESLQFQKEMIEEEREEAGEKKIIEKDSKSEQQDLIALSSSENKDTSPFNEPVFSSRSQGESENEAVAKVVDIVPSEERKKLNWTLQELQALSDMARDSSLRREISEFTILQAYIESLSNKKSKSKLNSEESKKENGLADPNDKEFVRMKSVVSSMLDRLKVKIDTTEKALGDKLKLLDKDGDGEITEDELKEAVLNVLKKANSLEEAQELVKELDTNNDGRVSLLELLQMMQKKQEKLEIETIEAKVNSGKSSNNDA